MTELISSLDLIVEYISDDESLSKTNFQALIQKFQIAIQTQPAISEWPG